MTQAYDHLAEWFEILNDDCDYPRWSQYFIEGLARLGAGREGFELGCGSGAFSRALARAGYSMTGGDISPAMLSKAAALSKQEGLEIPYVLTDASAMRAPKKYDFILSANDCFNYLPPEKLPAAFRRIAGCLKKGGIFWFDVSSEYKLREKVANNMFGDDREEVTYLEFNALRENRVETDVTLFVKEGELFRRYDEKHIRYIHSEGMLSDMLGRAGFEVRVEGHLGENASKSDRLNFICGKVSS